MKKIRGWRGKSLIIFSTLLIFSNFVQDICAQVADTITYGSVIRIKHKKTGKYLASGEEQYTHFKSSGQNAVYATDTKNDSQLWLLGGGAIGFPIKKGDRIALKNLKTGRNLHSHAGFPSPASGFQEVTAFGGNDTNDAWLIENDPIDDMRAVVGTGSDLKLVHVNTVGSLIFPSDKLFQEGKQEVACVPPSVVRREIDSGSMWKKNTIVYDNIATGGSVFVVELEQSPAQAEKTKADWQKGRGGTLNYNTIISIDYKFINQSAWNSRRLWTHGASRHGDNKAEPNNNVEILVGPNSDGRAVGESFFMVQNVANPLQTGPVKYGDKIKIVSLYASAGVPAKSGILRPFKYWWINNDSRHGKAYREIVISHPDNTMTQGEQSFFTLEAMFPGVTGEVYQNDMVRIRNLSGKQDVLWVYSDSRYGNTYYELLANNGDDPGKGREGFFNRFNLTHVNRAYLPAPVQKSLDDVQADLQLYLGAEAAKQQAELEKAKAAQAKAEKDAAEAALKVANEEAKRLAEASAKQMAEAQKKNEEAKMLAEQEAKKVAEALKQAELKAEAAKKLGEEEAKKAAEELKQTQLKAEEAKKLAAEEAIKAASLLKQTEERLAKEKELAIEEQKKAQDLINADARKREEALKTKFDAEAVARQRQLDEATALADEMKFVANLPIGFVKVDGKAKKVAVGLREETVNGKTKEVIDCWAIGMNDKLMVGSDGINPWTAHVAKDDKGTEIPGFKDIAIGGDGTTYAVTLDGKVYQYVRPGEKAKVVAPAAKKPVKAKKLRGKAKRKKSGKKIVQASSVKQATGKPGAAKPAKPVRKVVKKPAPKKDVKPVAPKQEAKPVEAPKPVETM